LQPEAAAAHVEDGAFDFISFGRLFLANADLVEKLATGSPFRPYTRDVFDQTS